MASTKIFFIIAIVAVLAIPSVLAVEFVVGDNENWTVMVDYEDWAEGKEFVVGENEGWTTMFDYQAWAKGKEFRVGDKLVFKYMEGAHNVIEVDANTFKQCVVPPASEALTSGYDEITLVTPGTKWYICGIGKHCEMGKQKLGIIVLPQLASAASSPCGSPASGSIQTSEAGGSNSSSPESSISSGSPASASIMTSAARGSTTSIYYGWMVAIFATLVMVMV